MLHVSQHLLTLWDLRPFHLFQSSVQTHISESAERPFQRFPNLSRGLLLEQHLPGQRPGHFSLLPSAWSFVLSEYLNFSHLLTPGDLWTLHMYAQLYLWSSFPVFLSFKLKPLKCWFFCSTHLNTLHIRISSDPSSKSELFCFHLDRLTRDHWRRRLTGSSSGRRSQALESSHQSGVRQDHKWLLQVSVCSVPGLVSLGMVWGIYPFQALCKCWWGHWFSSARASSLQASPSDPLEMTTSGGTWRLFDPALGSLWHWRPKQVLFIEGS